MRRPQLPTLPVLAALCMGLLCHAHAATAPSPRSRPQAGGLSSPRVAGRGGVAGRGHSAYGGARPPLNLPPETLRPYAPLDLGRRGPGAGAGGVPGPVGARLGELEVVLARGVAAGAAAAALAVAAPNTTANATATVAALLAVARLEAARAGALAPPQALANVSVAACASTCPRERDDDYPYPHVLRLALDFYHAQRSGALPPNDTYALTWRASSVPSDPFPAHFDAGDHLLLLFPYGQTMSLLGWAFLPENFRSGFEASPGAAASLRYTLRRGAEAVMAAHAGGPLKYKVQVGEEHADHAYWGRPEDLSMPRPVLELDGGRGINGSDAAAEGVAALAAAALAWQGVDPVFSAAATKAARSLFAFASSHEGYFSDGLPIGDMYPSGSFLDDLTWGAAWMARLTGEREFLEAASRYWDRMVVEEPHALLIREQSWSFATPAAAVLLASLAPHEPKYAAFAYLFVETHIQGASPVAYTPAGLAYRNAWGSLRNAMNPALVAGIYGGLLRRWAAEEGATATTTTTTAPRPSPPAPSPTAALGRLYQCWGRGQARYALGDTGRSFVVGWGDNPPTHVHHRAASCALETGGAGSNSPTCGSDDFASPLPNPQDHVGALAGGPNAEDQYTDVRSDYVGNEVALDYNAAFTGVLAMLSQETDTWNDCMTTFPADLRPILRVV